MEETIYLYPIDWDKAYSIRHEKIDNEHKEYFN